VELLSQLTQGGVVNFLLLYARFISVFAFFPFFENRLLLTGSKAALAFYLTILFLPTVPTVMPDITVGEFFVALLCETLTGLIASIFLQMAFYMLSYASEIISFVMGFTMASAYDPASGAQKPIIGQILSMLAVMVLLASDLHHLIIQYVYISINEIPLGGYIFTQNAITYILKATTNLFLMGFTIAFPITALILFSDIIFGMIMKTNPQFNILAIGFPVKIAIAFVILIITLPSIMLIFKEEFKSAYNALSIILYQ